MKITKEYIKGLVKESLEENKKEAVNENKITKSALQQIIKEEYQKIQNEAKGTFGWADAPRGGSDEFPVPPHKNDQGEDITLTHYQKFRESPAGQAHEQMWKELWAKHTRGELLTPAEMNFLGLDLKK